MNNSHPHLTVATVIERNGQFLMVEEHIEGRVVYNQPAGHVEPGESLTTAALRETREETGWDIELHGLLGAANYTSPATGVSFYRIAFAGKALAQVTARPPDEDIIACHWFTADEIRQRCSSLRSPLVLSTLQRHLDGRIYPLDFLF